MVKVVFVLISILSGFLIGFLGFNTFSWYYSLLISLGFTLASALTLVILFFVVFFILTFFENKNKKRNKQSKYFRNLLKIFSYFLFSLFGMKVKCTGLEKLEKDKAYLIISNHRSNLDSLLIDTYLKKYKLVFIAKNSLFKIPFVGKMIHGCAYVSLDRDNLKQEFFAIKDAIRFVEEENTSIGIFPEGTRTRNKDYTLGEFKAGSFSIAKKSHCPIVLSGVRYTDDVNNNLLFKKHIVFYDIIKVLQYDEYKDMSTSELSIYCKNIIETYLKENIL